MKKYFLIASIVLLVFLDIKNKASEKPFLREKHNIDFDIAITPIISNWGIQQIKTEKAWKQSKGDKRIVVAIIDTGMDLTHPELKENLWKNDNEIPNNFLDDDGNGYIDDIHGWNFVENNSDLTDRHGHGTHVAGIIGARNLNHTIGVAPNVSLMVLKYYDPIKPIPDNIRLLVQAIEYAVSMDADIINFSGGGSDFSREEYLAIQKAAEKGILFVAAAGNEKNNSDLKKFYPADYELLNIISVTALDENDQILKSSNYGKKSVDIAAPGGEIYSTLPNKSYGRMSGTSQATAFVTGVAVLLMSNKNMKNPELVIQQLLSTSDFLPQLENKTKSNAKLNAYKPLVMKASNISAVGDVIEQGIDISDFLMN